MTLCIGDFPLVKHERQELCTKESSTGLVLKLEVERMAGRVRAMVRVTAAKGFEDIRSRLDLCADL